MKEKDIKSLEHTAWRCQYHIVFAPKYRHMAIYGQLKKDIGWVLRKLCDEKGVEIIQAEACPDHIHMLLSIPPKYSIHNHIIWDSTSIDCTWKFRNFWGSTRAVQRLNDMLCIENGLSIVENPKRHGRAITSGWAIRQCPPTGNFYV